MYVCVLQWAEEAGEIMRELSRTTSSREQLISELSTRARDNPLLPNLLNLSRTGGLENGMFNRGLVLGR